MLYVSKPWWKELTDLFFLTDSFGTCICYMVMKIGWYDGVMMERERAVFFRVQETQKGLPSYVETNTERLQHGSKLQAGTNLACTSLRITYPKLEPNQLKENKRKRKQESSNKLQQQRKASWLRRRGGRHPSQTFSTWNFLPSEPNHQGGTLSCWNTFAALQQTLRPPSSNYTVVIRPPE